MPKSPDTIKNDTFDFFSKFSNDLMCVFSHVNEHANTLKWKPGDSLQTIHKRLTKMNESGANKYGPSKYPFEFLSDIDRKVFIVDFVHDSDGFSEGVIKCIFRIAKDPRTFCCQADIQSWGDSNTQFQLPIFEVYPKPVTYTVYQPVEEVICSLDILQMMEE